MTQPFPERDPLDTYQPTHRGDPLPFIIDLSLGCARDDGTTPTSTHRSL